MVSHQPATFDSHEHYGSEDITVLVYHVILQDHMIKGLCNLRVRALQARSPSSKSGGHENCGSEDLMILVCDIILQKLLPKIRLTLCVVPSR